jgi:hypothetical protein
MVLELKAPRDGLADVDESKVKAVVFVETPSEVALFRLRPRYMAQTPLDRAQNCDFIMSDYNLPEYY